MSQGLGAAAGTARVHNLIITGEEGMIVSTTGIGHRRVTCVLVADVKVVPGQSDLTIRFETTPRTCTISATAMLNQSSCGGARSTPVQSGSLALLSRPPAAPVRGRPLLESGNLCQQP